MRTAFFEGNNGNGNELWEDFTLFGMYGLFRQAHDNKEYVVEVYQMPSLRWCGKIDPSLPILREVIKQLTGIEQ